MPSKVDMDENELERLYRGGVPTRGLATRFSCSATTIKRRLRKLGFSPGRSGKQNPRWKGGERLDITGYAEIMQRGHRRANTEGYVKRSIIMWEKFHGKPFPKERVPHHINGDKLDDDPKNILSLLPVEHSILHARMKRRGDCGKSTREAKR